MTTIDAINLTSEQLETSADIDAAVAVIEKFFENRWTDGLPVVPPTPRLVAAMIAYAGRDPKEELGEIPPRRGIATVEKLAINAVMAGCKPEYFPVVLKAVECCLDPQFGLNGVLTTMQPFEPLVIVSGPVVKKLGINTREAVFGWGSRANGTIGRAMRLIFWNLGGAFPADADKSTFSHPGAWSFCIGEDSENNPWSPFHADMGLPPGASAVTVFPSDAPRSIAGTNTARAVLDTVCNAMSTVGPGGVYLRAPQLLVISPSNADILAKEGWTKQEIRAYIRDHARIKAGVAKKLGFYFIIDHGPASSRTGWAKWLGVQDDEDMVPVLDRPESLYIMVAGGKGPFCALCPGWGSQRLPVTREIPATWVNSLA